MRFRPCIDLREGQVVQIVGGSLVDGNNQEPLTNFRSEKSSAEYAAMYRRDDLTGGHVISLGPGNKEAALAALRAWPGGLQYGGGVNPENAGEFLDAGASHVIVTSYVFSKGRVDRDRLQGLVQAIGRERIVLDLSCRKRDGVFWIVTDRWQRFTEVAVNAAIMAQWAGYCDEFLVHGVDVEGKMQGIQEELVSLLAEHASVPVTYAGGAKSLADLELVNRLGRGRVDLTIGSALDIFGGDVPYQDVVSWSKAWGLAQEQNRNRVDSKC